MLAVSWRRGDLAGYQFSGLSMYIIQICVVSHMLGLVDNVRIRECDKQGFFFLAVPTSAVCVS